MPVAFEVNDYSDRSILQVSFSGPQLVRLRTWANRAFSILCCYWECYGNRLVRRVRQSEATLTLMGVS